jgi:hypothetical protein
MTRTAVTDADFYLIEQTLDDDGRPAAAPGQGPFGDQGDGL